MASRRKEEVGKNVEFVQIGVLEAEFDKCKKQLFSELQKAHARIADLDKEVNQKSGIIVNLNREVTEQKYIFAKSIASKEERWRILSLEVNEKHTKNNELKKENDMLERKYDKEIKYLQSLNVEHKKNIERLNDHIKKMNIDMKNLSCKHRKEAEQLEYDLNETRHAFTCKENVIKIRSTELDTLGTEKRKLCELVKTLTTEVNNLKSTQEQIKQRLHELAGANPTLNNPNIADLSDEKRPTKLAEEFSELYDNEWTEAFEDMEDKEERDKASYLLFLLQRASDICRDISDTHIQDIKKGLCHMTFRTKLVLSSEEDNKSPTVNEIIFNFDSLQNVQKKTVMELGKLIETNVSHQIEEDVANAIVAENKIDVMKEEMMFKYIKKCVNVCWSMCRHEPPVHIEFPDIQGDQKFDSNVFKPYTKSGKRLHYVVWPALYLHKDGPMLCKGVAQGR